MSRTKKCHNTAHVDIRMRGGKRVRCSACGDVFPCRNEACGHLDCGWVRSGEQTLAEALGARVSPRNDGVALAPR